MGLLKEGFLSLLIIYFILTDIIAKRQNKKNVIRSRYFFYFTIYCIMLCYFDMVYFSKKKKHSEIKYSG